MSRPARRPSRTVTDDRSRLSVRPLRQRPLLVIAAVVLIVTTTGACTGQSSARSYSDDVEEEFLFGCTTGGEAVVDGRAVRSDTTDPEERRQIEEAQADMEAEVPNIGQVCQCTYDRLERSVPFDDLKKVTNELEREPDALPANLREISEGCAESEGTPS